MNFERETQAKVCALSSLCGREGRAAARGGRRVALIGAPGHRKWLYLGCLGRDGVSTYPTRSF